MCLLAQSYFADRSVLNQRKTSAPKAMKYQYHFTYGSVIVLNELRSRE